MSKGSLTLIDGNFVLKLQRTVFGGLLHLAELLELLPPLDLGLQVLQILLAVWETFFFFNRLPVELFGKAGQVALHLYFKLNKRSSVRHFEESTDIKVEQKMHMHIFSCAKSLQITGVFLFTTNKYLCLHIEHRGRTQP